MLHTIPPQIFTRSWHLEKDINVISRETYIYIYFVVCKFARMLHLKIVSFKHYEFYNKHQYSGIPVLHGQQVESHSCLPSQSIFAKKNLAQFYAIKDYISFYTQTPQKYFQISLYVRDLTIRSYCHITEKEKSGFRTQGRHYIGQELILKTAHRSEYSTIG